MGSHRRSSEMQASELRSKLRRVVCSHDQMKIAFHQLKSQIRIGLLQAEDVFASLAIPLMKLVGLKTVQMAKEGRFTTITIQSVSNSHRQSFGLGTASGSSDPNRHSAKEDVFSARTAMAGKLMMQKQKDQLVQLVRILKQIETQVNGRQSHMVQTLGRRRLYLQKFFRRALEYLSTVDRIDHRSLQISIMKLLHAVFEEVGAVLGFVETDVEKLLVDLGEQICDPMVQYVKSANADLINGNCVRFVGMVKEMAMAASEARAELEAARNKATVAEASRIEALGRLREAEDNVTKLKECLKLPEPSKTSTNLNKPFSAQKFLGMEKEQANDEKLLWELLEKKRKYEAPQSPFGVGQLFLSESNYNKRQKSAKAKPPAVTSTYLLRARTPRSDARIPLGSSPSVATIQQAASNSLKKISLRNRNHS